MKQLIIIGARGYGRETYHLATQCKEFNKDWTIKGFLDDKSDALCGFDDYPPILDSVENYTPVESDALGSVAFKEKYINIILNKSGKFVSLIHPTVILNPTAIIGTGVILCAFSFISNDVKLGNYVTIQTHAAIGHDVVIGDYCQINSNTFLGGFCNVDTLVTINAGAVIIDRRKIAKNATVGAGSVVIRNVKENVTVFGNPAREM